MCVGCAYEKKIDLIGMQVQHRRFIIPLQRTGLRTVSTELVEKAGKYRYGFGSLEDDARFKNLNAIGARVE